MTLRRNGRGPGSGRGFGSAGSGGQGYGSAGRSGGRDDRGPDRGRRGSRGDAGADTDAGEDQSDVEELAGADPATGEASESGGDGDTAQQVYAKALGLLSRREHSQRELRRKLDRKGYTADESAVAVQRLQQQSFQSDQRFAQMLVRSRVAQGQGPRRILAELRTHGITDDDAREALEQEGTDWLTLARRIHARRYGQASSRDPQETRRRAAFLLRRGFDAATVRAITHADDVDDSAEEFD